jgi:predicted oxidoreductase
MMRNCTHFTACEAAGLNIVTDPPNCASWDEAWIHDDLGFKVGEHRSWLEVNLQVQEVERATWKGHGVLPSSVYTLL